MIDITLIGLKELQANLGKVDPATRSRLRTFMAAFTIRLRDQVQTNIVDRFKSTGPLYQSIQSVVEEDTGSVTGRVFSQGVRYAAIQEYGGTIQHPGSNKLQVFPGRDGKMIFTRRTAPHAINIPERSYARLALVQLRAPFENGIREVVSSAIGDAHLNMAAE